MHRQDTRLIIISGILSWILTEVLAEQGIVNVGVSKVIPLLIFFFIINSSLDAIKKKIFEKK